MYSQIHFGFVKNWTQPWVMGLYWSWSMGKHQKSKNCYKICISRNIKLKLYIQILNTTIFINKFLKYIYVPGFFSYKGIRGTKRNCYCVQNKIVMDEKLLLWMKIHCYGLKNIVILLIWAFFRDCYEFFRIVIHLLSKILNCYG